MTLPPCDQAAVRSVRVEEQQVGRMLGHGAKSVAAAQYIGDALEADAEAIGRGCRCWTRWRCVDLWVEAGSAQQSQGVASVVVKPDPRSIFKERS